MFDATGHISNRIGSEVVLIRIQHLYKTQHAYQNQRGCQQILEEFIFNLLDIFQNNKQQEERYIGNQDIHLQYGQQVSEQKQNDDIFDKIFFPVKQFV